MNTENLSTLKINKLTQAQYDRELEAGRIDENALYLTPYEENPVMTIDEYPNCYFRMVDGEREWINPPMIDGVRYRTTERHNNKPVYVFGARIATTDSIDTQQTYDSLLNTEDIISITGTKIDSSGYVYSLNSAEHPCTVYYNYDTLYVSFSDGHSITSVVITLKFTLGDG